MSKGLHIPFERPRIWKGLIYILILVHLSGLIGLGLGHLDFFLPKTPFTLLLLCLASLLLFNLKYGRVWIIAGASFITGMLVEYLGVNHGLLFGEYSYGANLGPKFQGVPWTIGLNWTCLTLLTGLMADSLTVKKWIRILLGAVLMVLLDFVIEPLAPILDFWEFKGGIAPLQNYIAWFGIAALLHGLYQSLNLDGHRRGAWIVYFIQFLFFTILDVFYFL